MNNKMIELTYKKFDEEFNKYKNIHPSLLYFEDLNKFVLFFKNPEKWKFYTIINKSDIIELGNYMSNSEEESIRLFKSEILYNAINILSYSKFEIKPELNEIFEEAENIINEIEEEPETMTKKTDIDTIEESEDYEEFYNNVIKSWKNKVLKEFNNSDLNKGLIDFKKIIQSIMNIKPFIKQLPKIIKSSFKVSIDQAEKELNVQIGYRPIFDKKVETLTKQQLTGYTINGKKWFGIKGVTDEQSQDIYNIVSEGVKNKKSQKEISADITQTFDEIIPTRANMIARTETTRILNESKIESYKASKIKGFKTWNAVMDKKTRPLHRRLAIKYGTKGIPFDDEFVDEKTGTKINSPPLDPNCRCVVGISFKKHPQH